MKTAVISGSGRGDSGPLARAVRMAAAAALLLAGPGAAPAVAGAPTLQTITIDGNMGDWAAVLSDPDNVYLDDLADPCVPLRLSEG